ncbi:MAG: preprotein translocase subunit SecY [Proteobacteria bacterium]|nr:preprotein translocase subunit SecY [Pseudomonadota bacterium]MCL2307376.1 preprotein translocase subunit SecY [Pseudomonadota bacterium]
MATLNPAAKIGGKYGDLAKRLWFLLGAMIVYRIGTHIPVPGVNAAVIEEMLQGGGGGLLGMMDLFSGGALQRVSILTLGVMPYITASIIMQLCSAMMPSLEAIKKEGEAGRRKITQYTRYLTVLLAFIQGMGVAVAFEGMQGMVLAPGFAFKMMCAITLVTGTMFLMWLGEQITERGLGNGISLIICAGIVAGLPSAIGLTLENVNTGAYSIPLALGVAVLVVVVTGVVVFFERAQRRVLVQYAKRQVGNRIAPAQSSYLPFKLNMAGVIPAIFASAIIMFPATMAQLAGGSEGPFAFFLKDVSAMLAMGQPLHEMLYAAAIIFFCFFYTALQYKPTDTADNLKKSGALIPGYRPGKHTADYLEKIMLRLTLLGSLYLVVVCFIPNFLIAWKNVPFYFGGTSLLIVVVVTIDFMSQVQAYMMSQQYESLLKKANFKGGALR